MQYVYLIPNWFFGVDVIFELAFAMISLAVSLYAFKVYRLSEQNQLRLFGYSFLFISISYFIQSLLNFAIISKLNENICAVLRIEAVNTLNTWGIYSHMFLFISGIVTLISILLKINSKKVYSLILILSFLIIIFSVNKIYSFYFLSSILLIYISLYYFTNCLKKKDFKSLLVSIAFIFLLIGNIHFMFAVNRVFFYVLGHFLELIAYLLILINLFLILKNDKKKK